MRVHYNHGAGFASSALCLFLYPQLALWARRMPPASLAVSKKITRSEHPACVSELCQEVYILVPPHTYRWERCFLHYAETSNVVSGDSPGVSRRRFVEMGP